MQNFSNVRNFQQILVIGPKYQSTSINVWGSLLSCSNSRRRIAINTFKFKTNILSSRKPIIYNYLHVVTAIYEGRFCTNTICDVRILNYVAIGSHVVDGNSQHCVRGGELNKQQHVSAVLHAVARGDWTT